MNKRELEILHIVTTCEKIEVTRLAEMLKVSPVTIRKALDVLETKGLITREHGYAIAGAKDDINNRLAVNYAVKQGIARAASGLVKNGETVMIESGSSCALLAELLATEKQNVTIITNSAFIAHFIKDKPYAKVILLGGEYQSASQVMVGSLVKKCLEGFFVDKLFIGADGFSKTAGFTGKDLPRAEAVQNMKERAERVIVLTDSSKFAHQGVVALLPPEDIAMVVTDTGINPETEACLLAQRVKVLKA